MESRPLISVIIPAFNAAETIQDSVESVLQQTYRPLEILVIDDGSTDNTYEVLANVDSSVKVLRQSNAGPAAARNFGLREATGTWIAFLDADDRWVPEKLTQQFEYLSQHLEVGLVHTDVIFFESATQQQWQTSVGRERFVGHCTDKLLMENRILASSVLVNRKHLDETGLFDERFKGVEDYDLWLRLSKVCEFAFIASPLVLYCVQPGSLSTHSLAMRKGELEVLQKALSESVKSGGKQVQLAISPSQLRTRLWQLNWDIGYQAFEQEDYAQARSYLGQALRWNPWNLRAAYLWMSTWLPKGLTSRLRLWKHRVSSSTDQATA